MPITKGGALNFQKEPSLVHDYLSIGGQYGIRIFVGGIWIFLWIIIILTDIRWIRRLFKINWTKSDEMQMREDFDRSTTIKLFIFQAILIIMSFLWTRTEFTYDCLYYGICEGLVIGIGYTVKVLYNLLSTRRFLLKSKKVD